MTTILDLGIDTSECRLQREFIKEKMKDKPLITRINYILDILDYNEDNTEEEYYTNIDWELVRELIFKDQIMCDYNIHNKFVDCIKGLVGLYDKIELAINAPEEEEESARFFGYMCHKCGRLKFLTFYEAISCLDAGMEPTICPNCRS